MIDVAPTVLEVAGLPAPTLVNGVLQEPMHGTSMAYSFDDADAPEQHDTQYFEILCNRGIYHKGWSAVTRHHIPWEQHTAGVPLDEDVWELYDGTTDWTQAHDLAAEHPEKLAALQRLFLIEAGKYNVLPLDARMADRFNPELAGRPQLISGDSLVLFPGMRSLTENGMLNLKNKSHSITADIVVPEGGADGVLINQGGLTGGWVLYLKDGHLAYHYNFLGLQRASVVSGAPVPPGQHQVRMEFTYDGGGLGKGGPVTLPSMVLTSARDGSNARTRSCSRSTKRPTWGGIPARRSAMTMRSTTTPSPARSNGFGSTLAPTITVT